MNQIDAVAALVVRDLRSFTRSRSQLYSSVALPLMLLAILGAGVSDGLDPRRIHDYVTFLAPGMIAMTALFSSTFSGASYYQDRDSGILKVLLASPHSQRVVLLGKMLSAVVIGSAQALLVPGRRDDQGDRAGAIDEADRRPDAQPPARVLRVEQAHHQIRGQDPPQKVERDILEHRS